MMLILEFAQGLCMVRSVQIDSEPHRIRWPASISRSTIAPSTISWLRLPDRRADIMPAKTEQQHDHQDDRHADQDDAGDQVGIVLVRRLPGNTSGGTSPPEPAGRALGA